MPAEPVLITIPFSHYCEKARWALDRAGVRYREQGHLPFFSRFAGLRYGAWNSVPLLCHGRSRLRSSSAIVAFADEQTAAEARLHPTDPAAQSEVRSLEETFDQRLGPHARRVAYAHILDQPILREAVASAVPRAEAALLPVIFPLIREGIRRGLRIDARGIARSRVVVDEVFAEVADRLRDGRRYLVGDRFTAADLAFAALACPGVFPEAYAARFPSLDGLPRAALDDIDRLRATPAGQFVLRLYAEERRPTA